MTEEDFFDQSMNKSFQIEIEFAAFMNGMKSVLQTNMFARGITKYGSSSQYRDILLLDLESRDCTLVVLDETTKNKYIMAQLKLDVHNLIQAHFKEGIQLSQPEMTGYCKYFSAALNADDLKVSRDSLGAIGTIFRLHLRYNVGGNIQSGSLDFPIIQSNLEPHVFTLIQSTSRSLTWKQPSLYSNLLYCQNPLSLISTHQGTVPLSTVPNTVPSAVEPAAKRQTTSKAKSSSRPYKKTAGGTNIFVGGGSHFHGIAKKPK